MVKIGSVEEGEKTGSSSFSAAQMEVLTALCDTFLPSIDVSQLPVDDLSAIKFYQTSASMAGTPQPVNIHISLFFSFSSLKGLLAFWVVFISN